MRNAALFLLLALAAGPAGAGTFYYASSPTNDTGASLTFSSGPYDGIGDSIGLTSPIAGTDAILQLFNDGASGGTFDATLTFFQVGPPVGDQIGSSFTLTGNAVGALSYVNLDFTLGYQSLPANLVFILQVSNVSSGVDLGLELYSDPTLVGANIADTAIVHDNTGYNQVPTGGGNPYFELSGVPEPSTWVLAGAGLVLAAWRKKASARF
jgi:hypothetical protein